MRPNKASTLYKEQGITFDKRWESKLDETVSDNSTEQTTDPKSISEPEAYNSLVANKNYDWSEDDAEISAGFTDSMLTTTDFLNYEYSQFIIFPKDR